jgi:hypothetical protein
MLSGIVGLTGQVFQDGGEERSAKR